MTQKKVETRIKRKATQETGKGKKGETTFLNALIKEGLLILYYNTCKTASTMEKEKNL